MLFCRFAMCFSAFFLATALVHAQNDFRIDVDSAFGGEPITTEPGFTSLDATTGNGSSVVVDGTTFTVFSAAGSRNRNTGTNPLTRDFVFDDGASAAVGLTVDNLPAGIYRANVYSFDADFPIGNQFVGMQSGVAGGTLFTDSYAGDETAPFSFVFSSENLPSGGGIFTRENNGNNRSRFNGLELTPLNLTPSTQYNIDIDSTQGGTPLQTAAGFTSLQVDDLGTGSVMVDGVTFETFNAAGSRNRQTTNDLTSDFVFDAGAGSTVGLRVFDLPDGIYEVMVYSHDEDFPPGDQAIGVRNFDTGFESIFTDTFASSGTDPFTFVIDSSTLGDGFGIFARENSTNDRSRFNGLQLTLLEPAAVPEPTTVALWTLLGLGLVGYRRWRRS